MASVGSYPVLSEDSFAAHALAFTKFDGDEKESTGTAAASHVPASNPYRHAHLSSRVPAYQSSYTNALHGLSAPSRRLPSSIFAPLAPFPVAPSMAAAPRGYHATRNPYAYRGAAAGRWDVDSEDEEDEAEREALARRVMAELDAEAHVDPRIEFDPYPERGGRFRMLPDSPPYTARAAGQAAAPMAVRSMANTNHRAQSSNSRATSLQPPAARHDMATSYTPQQHPRSMHEQPQHLPVQPTPRQSSSSTPIAVTPSLTPAQARSRSPMPTGASTSRTHRVRRRSVSESSSAAAESDETREYSSSVASIEQPPPPRPPPAAVPHPRQHHRPQPQPHLQPRMNRHEHINRIWAYEEELELIHRRRILSSQLFEHETMLHEVEVAKTIALKQSEDRELSEALKREQIRRGQWAEKVVAHEFPHPHMSATRRGSTASGVPSLSHAHQPIPVTQQSQPDEDYLTPDGSVKEPRTGPGSVSHRPGLSMDALQTPADFHAGGRPAQPPSGLSTQVNSPTITHRPTPVAQPMNHHSLQQPQSQPQASPGFMVLSSGMSTPALSLRPQQSRPAAHPVESTSPAGDIPDSELAGYRSYALGSSRAARDARMAEMDEGVEESRGVDRLPTSRARQTEERDVARIQQAVATGRIGQEYAPHRLTSPTNEDRPLFAYASQPAPSHSSPHHPPPPLRPASPLLPTFLRASRPAAASAYSTTTTRKAFGATLRTTPPDSPRARGRDDTGVHVLHAPSGSGQSTARSNATEELDTDAHRYAILTASPEPRHTSVTTHASHAHAHAARLLSASYTGLSPHAPLVRALALEERAWDTALQRKAAHADMQEREARMREEVQRKARHTAQEEESRRSEEAHRARLRMTVEHEASHTSARLDVASRKAQLASAKLQEETHLARQELAEQRWAAERAWQERTAALAAEEQAVRGAKQLQARSAHDLAQTLAAQALVQDRLARFQADAQAHKEHAAQERNAALREKFEDRQASEREKRERWEREKKTWNTEGDENDEPSLRINQLKSEYRSKTNGLGLDDELDDVKPENVSTIAEETSQLLSSSIHSLPTGLAPSDEDHEWKALTSRVANLLPAETIAQLPRVIDAPSSDVAVFKSPAKAKLGEADPNSLRSTATISRDLDLLQRGALPASDISSASIPAFYSHLRSELASLQDLRATLDQQQRTLLVERLALAQERDAAWERTCDEKTAARYDGAVKDARRSEIELEQTLATVRTRERMTQDAVNRIRSHSRERAAALELAAVTAQKDTRDLATRRRSFEEQVRERRKSLDVLTATTLSALEIEAQQKRQAIRDLDQALEQRRLASNAAASQLKPAASVQPIVAGSRASRSSSPMMAQSSRVPPAIASIISPTNAAAATSSTIAPSNPSSSINDVLSSSDSLSLDLSLSPSDSSSELRAELARETAIRLATEERKATSKLIKSKVSEVEKREKKDQEKQRQTEQQDLWRLEIDLRTSPVSDAQSKKHRQETVHQTKVHTEQKTAAAKIISPTGVVSPPLLTNEAQRQLEHLKTVAPPSQVTSPTEHRSPSPMNSSLLNSPSNQASSTRVSLAERFEARVAQEREQKEREVEKRRIETLQKTVVTKVVSPTEPTVAASAVITPKAVSASARPASPVLAPHSPVKAFAPPPRAASPVSGAPVLRAASPSTHVAPRVAAPRVAVWAKSPRSASPVALKAASAPPAVAAAKPASKAAAKAKVRRSVLALESEDELESSTDQLHQSSYEFGDASEHAPAPPIAASAAAGAGKDDSGALSEFDFDSLMDASLQEVVTATKPNSSASGRDTTSTAVAAAEPKTTAAAPFVPAQVDEDDDIDDDTDLSMSLSISTIGEEKLTRAQAALTKAKAAAPSKKPEAPKDAEEDDLFDSLLADDKTGNFSYELSFDDASYKEFMHTIKNSEEDDDEPAGKPVDIKAKLSIKRDPHGGSASVVNTSSVNTSKLGGLQIGGRPVNVVVTPAVASTAASASSVSLNSAAPAVKPKGSVSSLAAAFSGGGATKPSVTAAPVGPQKRTSSVAAAISAFNKKVDDEEEEAGGGLFSGMGSLARKKKPKGAPPPMRTDLVPLPAPVVLRKFDDAPKPPQPEEAYEMLDPNDPEYEPPVSAAVMSVILRRDNPRRMIREGLVNDMLLKLEVNDRQTGIKKGTVAFGVQMLLDANIIGKNRPSKKGASSSSSSTAAPGRLSSSASYAATANALKSIHPTRK